MGSQLDLDDVAADHPLAFQQLHELRAQLAEAQMDSERLDWLNANACEFVMESDNEAIPGFSYHPNVRAAIDAAKGEPS